MADFDDYERHYAFPDIRTAFGENVAIQDPSGLSHGTATALFVGDVETILNESNDGPLADRFTTYERNIDLPSSIGVDTDWKLRLPDGSAWLVIDLRNAGETATTCRVQRVSRWNVEAGGIYNDGD